MLDPPTHNSPFVDKRDKVGIDGVSKTEVPQTIIRKRIRLMTKDHVKLIPKLNIITNLYKDEVL